MSGYVYFAFRAVWLIYIIFLMIFMSPYAELVDAEESALLFWDMVIVFPATLMFLGHSFWRKVCPLAAVSLIPWKTRSMIGRGAKNIKHQKISNWVSQHHLKIQFFFFLFLVTIRFSIENSTFLVLFIIGVFAFLSGFIADGRIWCNNFCPLSPLQKIYSGNGGIFEEIQRFFNSKSPPHSTCSIMNGKKSLCVDCTSSCPDKNIKESFSIRTFPKIQSISSAYLALIVAFSLYGDSNQFNQPLDVCLKYGVLTFIILYLIDAAIKKFSTYKLMLLNISFSLKSWLSINIMYSYMLIPFSVNDVFQGSAESFILIASTLWVSKQIMSALNINIKNLKTNDSKKMAEENSPPSVKKGIKKERLEEWKHQSEFLNHLRQLVFNSIKNGYTLDSILDNAKTKIEMSLIQSRYAMSSTNIDFVFQWLEKEEKHHMEFITNAFLKIRNLYHFMMLIRSNPIHKSLDKQSIEQIQGCIIEFVIQINKSLGKIGISEYSLQISHLLKSEFPPQKFDFMTPDQEDRFLETLKLLPLELTTIILNTSDKQILNHQNTLPLALEKGKDIDAKKIISSTYGYCQGLCLLQFSTRNFKDFKSLIQTTGFDSLHPLVQELQDHIFSNDEKEFFTHTLITKVIYLRESQQLNFISLEDQIFLAKDSVFANESTLDEEDHLSYIIIKIQSASDTSLPILKIPKYQFEQLPTYSGQNWISTTKKLISLTNKNEPIEVGSNALITSEAISQFKAVSEVSLMSSSTIEFKLKREQSILPEYKITEGLPISIRIEGLRSPRRMFFTSEVLNYDSETGLFTVRFPAFVYRYERRNFMRTNYQTVCQINFGEYFEKSMWLMVHDLSEGGVLVSPKITEKIGTNVQLNLHLDSNVYRAQGNISIIKQDTMVISFSDSNETTQVSRFIYSKILENMNLPNNSQKLWSGDREFFVTRKVQESEDCLSIYLQAKTPMTNYDYKPGQFIVIGLIINQETVYRCYSLSRSSKENEYRITVKKEIRKDGSFGLVSSFIHNSLNIGDLVLLKHPRGDFTIDEISESPVTLIAGGIGITPMIAMIETVLKIQPQRSVTLMYSVENSSRHTFKQDLQEYKEKYDNLKVYTVYSNPLDVDVVAVDYDSDKLIDIEKIRSFSSKSNTDFYICGSPMMMKSLQDQLLDWGVHKNRVHTEAFSAASNTENKGWGQVEFLSQQKSFPYLEENGSILNLAEQHEIKISSSCKQGSCGTCRAFLIKGQVKQVTNGEEKLFSSPGEILTCCTVPQGEIIVATYDEA